ncbi:MAG TPA: P63C domain-containing protein [Bradyrhizobium sp.]|nr:P63C domain-containing protein [Bradyrhizobium sp.]
MADEPTGRAKGGVARAAALSSERRKEIARNAVTARWQKDVPFATHIGELTIGDRKIECAVLNDGRRVLSQRGVNGALGRRHGGSQFKHKQAGEHGGKLPIFLSPRSLKDHISNDLATVLQQPILYKTGRGGPLAHGMDATLLPQVCDVWIKADEKGDLNATQTGTADSARLLLRGLAHVGIVGLVDEATGYQEVRDKMALQTILDAYLRKELAAWAKRFPDEFYEHIFRLRGWEWKGRGKNPPQVVAAYTKDIVYARLAPHILEELERRNPSEGGRRRGAHHQWLTEDVGHPALAQHLHAVITLMRVSKNWAQFKLMLDVAHPKRGDTLQLPLMADFTTDPIPPKKTKEVVLQESLFDSELLKAAAALAWKDDEK